MVRGILYNTRLPKPRDTRADPRQAVDEIPAHGPVIVVGLPPATSAPNDRRYPIAVIGRGYHGLLMSSLTRVPGLVSIADVARTALQTPHALDWRRDGGARRDARTGSRTQIEVARSTTMPGSVLVLVAARLLRALLPARRADRARRRDRRRTSCMGWFPTGDTAPRVDARSALCTVAGGCSGRRSSGARRSSASRWSALLAAYAASMARAAVDALARADRARADEPLLRRLEPARDVAALPRAPRRGAPHGALRLARVPRGRRRSRSRRSPRTSSARTAAARSSSASRSRCSRCDRRRAAAVHRCRRSAPPRSSSRPRQPRRRRSSGPDHLRGALHGGINGFMNVAANRVPLAYARMVEQWWLLDPRARGRRRRHRASRAARRSRTERAVAIAMLGGARARRCSSTTRPAR